MGSGRISAPKVDGFDLESRITDTQDEDNILPGVTTDSRYYLAVVGGAGWLAGIWLASATNLGLVYWLGFSVVALVGAVVLWRAGRMGLLLAGLAALALGAGRFVVAQLPTGPDYIDHFNGAEQVVLTAVVTEESAQYDNYVQLRVNVSEVVVGGRPSPVTGLVHVRAPRYPEIPYGAAVRLVGNLKPVEELGEPGYVEYLKRQGIRSAMFFPQIEVNSIGGQPIKRFMLAIRDHGRVVIRRSLPEPHAALLSGILLGDDSGMSDETVEAFRITGMTHIIAISGFNIALLIALVNQLLLPWLPRRTAAMLTMGFVIFYTALVGAEASVVRAATMGITFLIAASFLGRPTLAVAALFVASFVMTLWSPMIIWDVGFQLSFAATLGMMLFAIPWVTWTTSHVVAGSPSALRRRLARLVGDLVIVTLAAQVMTLPLLVYHFGRLSLASFPANLLVLPAQPGVMVTGGLTLLAGSLFPALGQVVGWLAWLFLNYTISIVGWLAQMSWAAIPFGLQPAGVWVIYLSIGAATGIWLMGNTRRNELKSALLRPKWLVPAAALVGLVVVALAAGGIFRQDQRLHVVFLDVGQGDATYLKTPDGKQILIDGGRYPSLLLEGLARQMPFWDRSLDMVIATHPDDDHVTGLVNVLERYNIDRLVSNGESIGGNPAFDAMLATAAEKSVAHHVAAAGEIYDLGAGVQLHILHPDPEFSRVDQNNASVVARLTYGDLSVMLTGDADTDVEGLLLRSGQPLSAVVLKAGHHGANSSSGQPFLEAVRPQFIVVSAGEANSYGHPHPAMLARAADIGATVLRTDELGTIKLMSDGQQLWWQSDN